LQALGQRADAVVVDTGNGLNGMKRRFWQAADLRLVVATPETAAILGAYASIKALSGGAAFGPIHTLVNLCAGAETCENAHGRLAAACRRFLAIELLPGGYIPAVPQIAAAARERNPLVAATPACPSVQHFDRLAQTAAATIGAEVARSLAG
jgi:flagellar biosynthesis protein FlhG